jgi:hypothetical protein
MIAVKRHSKRSIDNLTAPPHYFPSLPRIDSPHRVYGCETTLHNRRRELRKPDLWSGTGSGMAFVNENLEDLIGEAVAQQ